MKKNRILTIALLITATLMSCNDTKKQSLSTEESITIAAVEQKAEMPATIKNDSVYTDVYETARLENGHEFFKQNNKYADWSNNDKKTVVIKGVSKADGSTSAPKIIRSSENEKLDNEAIRLFNLMKLTPATNDLGEKVNSYYTVPISFPA